MRVAIAGVLFLSIAYEAQAVTEAELDAVCFPLYVNRGAVPGSSTCMIEAAAADATYADNNMHCVNTVQTPYNTTTRKRYCSQSAAMVGQQCKSQTKNPIEINYGAKFRKEVDISKSSGSGRLEFVRYFNSRFDPGSGDIGEGWRHNYSSRITLGISRDGQLGALMNYVRGDGTSYMLTRGVDGIFRSNQHSITAAEIPQAYKGKTKQFYVMEPISKTLEVFDANADGKYAQYGLLAEVWGFNGDFVQVTRGTSRQLISVQDGVNARKLSFSYFFDASNTPILLRGVTSPSSNAYEFRYSQTPPLSKYVRFAEVRRPFSAQDVSIRQYLYDEANLAPKLDSDYTALTGIIDTGFERYASISYSSDTETIGRATSSELGGGLVVERVSSPKYFDSSVGTDGAYVDLPRALELTVNEIKVEVTNPSGTVGRVYSQRFGGLLIPTISTQPAGSGCGASFTEKNTKVFNAAFGSEIAREGLHKAQSAVLDAV